MFSPFPAIFLHQFSIPFKKTLYSSTFALFPENPSFFLLRLSPFLSKFFISLLTTLSPFLFSIKAEDPTRNKTPSPTSSPKPKTTSYEHQNTHRAFQYDMLNPFFMHLSDNPSLALVTPHLSNSNYHSWSRSIKMALLSKNKLGFIDGTLTYPITSDNNQIAYDRCNTTVMSWIRNSI